MSSHCKTKPRERCDWQERDNIWGGSATPGAKGAMSKGGPKQLPGLLRVPLTGSVLCGANGLVHQPTMAWTHETWLPPGHTNTSVFSSRSQGS